MSKNKKTKQLTISQKKELEEWEKKIKSGEAYKIAEDVLDKLQADFEPKKSLENFAKTIIPKLQIKNEKLTNEEQKELYNIAMSKGLDNGFSMLETVEADYRGMIQCLRKELVKEYNCVTYSEKALVDLAINAYSRNLTMSKLLVNTSKMGYTTRELNNFISVMSKEVDRANRHFITALETLKQCKRPELKVNVKTNNAFIAEKQQFNQAKNENNENK